MKQISKRVLSIVIALSMMITIIPQQTFAYTYNEQDDPNYHYASELANLNLFKGTGNSYELNRVPTRLEGLVMLLRLLGHTDEEIARTNTNSIPFVDVPEWGKKYVAFAYNNNLTKGISYNKFGSNNPLTMRDYSTFVLRALKVPQNEYSWENADRDITRYTNLTENDTYRKNGYNESSHTGSFTRGDMAKFSYEALISPYNSTDQSLISHLKEKNKIDTYKHEKFITNYDYDRRVEKGIPKENDHIAINETLSDNYIISNDIKTNNKDIKNKKVEDKKDLVDNNNHEDDPYYFEIEVNIPNLDIDIVHNNIYGIPDNTIKYYTTEGYDYIDVNNYRLSRCSFNI